MIGGATVIVNGAVSNIPAGLLTVPAPLVARTMMFE